MSVTIRQRHGRPPFVLHRLSREPNRATTPVIRHDGLFDIFPESYWARFTALESVSLRCHLRAPARLRLLRRRLDDVGGEALLAETSWSPGTETDEVELSASLAPADGPDSCLLLEIIPTGPHTDPVISAAWESAQAPERTPRIGVVITTFNREPFLVSNLARLHRHMAGGCAVVVNHGEPGLEQRLRGQVPTDPAIRWIDQENSGGAGGFTRGMVEHHAAGDITHVLLMDDDIDMPDDLVERTAAILSFARPEICLGGAMFDYHARTQLFSAGDMLLPGSFGIGHVVPPDGCDIATAAGVDFLARVHRPDFNGWWCFAFPIEALEQVGLPMPCFIRGDDVEFGYRLKRAGMPTLGWPGLAVWHMPFAGKSAPWHMFYDRRNSLFANALHRRIGRLKAVGKLVGGFTHHLLRYDYDRVRAMTFGIAAFNAGPAAMACWTHREHAQLIAATSAMALASDEADGGKASSALTLPPIRLSGFARSLRMVGRLVLDLCGLPVGRATPYVLPHGDHWRPDYTQRPSLVIEQDGNGGTARVYRRDPAESRRAMLRCLRAMTGMLVRFHQDVPQAALGTTLGVTATSAH
ncbi:glycosyltransferase family 2 protein [Novosphingobium resinovorum]|uniref:glycosyltransferase family 2 protein n=2 Tax=Novosphingobium resinovorum TaxID=158500 RepID=UPI002329DA54|nr:hypothetical protein GCM10017612_20530 [Novosphingobium resinovorum]